MSHSSGERNLFSPGTRAPGQPPAAEPRPPRGSAPPLTESLEGVGHRLVLHHVDESSPQAEVREDEEDVLQDVVDAADFLRRQEVEAPPAAGRTCGVGLEKARRARTHVVSEQLHDEGGDAAVDADQDVDAGEDHVRRAGDLKEEGGGVHERRDGPPADETQGWVTYLTLEYCGVLCSTVHCSTVQYSAV